MGERLSLEKAKSEFEGNFCFVLFWIVDFEETFVRDQMMEEEASAARCSCRGKLGISELHQWFGG